MQPISLPCLQLKASHYLIGKINPTRKFSIVFWLAFNFTSQVRSSLTFCRLYRAKHFFKHAVERKYISGLPYTLHVILKHVCMTWRCVTVPRETLNSRTCLVLSDSVLQWLGREGGGDEDALMAAAPRGSGWISNAHLRYLSNISWGNYYGEVKKSCNLGPSIFAHSSLVLERGKPVHEAFPARIPNFHLIHQVAQ